MAPSSLALAAERPRRRVHLEPTFEVPVLFLEALFQGAHFIQGAHQSVFGGATCRDVPEHDHGAHRFHWRVTAVSAQQARRPDTTRSAPFVLTSRVNFSTSYRAAALSLLLPWTACSPQASSSSPQSPSDASPAPAPLSAPASAASAPDDARGGRLYDNWRAEKGLEKSFTVDSSKTPELDGAGGPNGNGSLNDAKSDAQANTGHDYRLKNLFGWDLRGKDGVYGDDYQKKAFVLSVNLLTDTRSPAELREWFEKGGDGVPAFGSVLDARDLDDLVAFVVKTRTKELVTPEAVFTLDKAAPKGFVLNGGGDATRGQQVFAQRCSKCHGDDGRKLAIDEVESVGSISRTAGYEIWFKIAHGQPGTRMGRQLSEAGGAAQAQTVLDLFAALCDRTRYPAIPTGKDVPNGDPRCGSYLR
ncbi:MAG: uncharacterized protein K0R38_4611 [Polyangiaceae bacterium]|nr:uncharacterized protein [Polyangiaceae bacterium]